MIKITCTNGRNVPQVLCDSCGAVIHKAGEGAVVFPNFSADGESTDLSHVHKNFVVGDCMSKAEGLIRAGGREPGWEELATHVAYLIANVGLLGTDIDKVLSRPDA